MSIPTLTKLAFRLVRVANAIDNFICRIVTAIVQPEANENECLHPDFSKDRSFLFCQSCGKMVDWIGWYVSPNNGKRVRCWCGALYILGSFGALCDGCNFKFTADQRRKMRIALNEWEKGPGRGRFSSDDAWAVMIGALAASVDETHR